MKFTIEAQDVETVKEEATFYGVLLTDEQAKRLIEDYRDIASELWECDGGFDDHERISAALIQEIMPEDQPPAVADKWGGTRWHWPEYGSREEYKKEFYKVFQIYAKEKGFKLSKDWDEKDG